MADEGTGDVAAENDALGLALAAEHAAVWGYGVVGAALAEADRGTATGAEAAHRDVRDSVVTLLSARSTEPAVISPASRPALS